MCRMTPWLQWYQNFENRIKIETESPFLVGVGGTVHFLGDGFKSMASPFLSKDIGINELNPKFY